MYKKILNLNSQASSGLNKAENATSTMTLKDLKTPSPMSSVNSVHQQQPTNTIERFDADVNDENDAPSNLAIENVVNGNDKVICENSLERPLATAIQTSSPSHHVLPSSPPPPLSKMETDDYSLEHNTNPTHKSIHHITTPYHDENLENKQQNFVNDDDDVWRPW